VFVVAKLTENTATARKSVVLKVSEIKENSLRQAFIWHLWSTQYVFYCCCFFRWSTAPLFRFDVRGLVERQFGKSYNELCKFWVVNLYTRGYGFVDLFQNLL